MAKKLARETNSASGADELAERLAAYRLVLADPHGAALLDLECYIHDQRHRLVIGELVNDGHGGAAYVRSPVLLVSYR